MKLPMLFLNIVAQTPNMRAALIGRPYRQGVSHYVIIAIALLIVQTEERTMKKLPLAFALASVFIFGVPAYAASTTPEPSPIVKKLLEHMRSGDQKLSLGAMLISVDVNDYRYLEPYVRGSLKDNDEPWIKAVRLYTISKYTLDDDDAMRFIQSVPEDKENFWKLIEFESGVTRHPGSKILDHLLYYARLYQKRELCSAAVDKLDKIQPVADGWVGEYIRPRY